MVRKSGVEKSYTSRWRLVLSAYNAIRIRVMNSEAHSGVHELALFNINEATLVNQRNFLLVFM